MNKKKYTWSEKINAPASRVHDIMLGVTDKNTYGEWTAPFGPGSFFEGDWQEGSRIRFVGKDEDGNLMGMVTQVVENKPGRFVSLHHLGIVNKNEEVFEGPEVEKWKDNFENYTFEESDGVTTVTVDIDLPEAEAHYFTEAWPKSLARLKEIAEANQ